MRRERDSHPPSGPDREGGTHGPHTLKVYTGTVVGRHGSDVFVELGVRMQGVISLDHFREPPELGARFEFTLRGQEDGLWVLARREEEVLATWENLELGSWVHARAVRAAFGGLEMKVGPLHAFLPKSHTGLARDEKPETLVGKQFTCEVIEIESQRQRVVLSRKLVLQRERAHPARDLGLLRVGENVHGRVARVEEYGAFVEFGQGLEGLVHVSNIAYERVGHPAEVLRVGQNVEARVLAIRDGGKRIALGLKQLQPNPWERLAGRIEVDDLLEARVSRVRDFGAFLSVVQGVEGFLPVAECLLAPLERLPDVLASGASLSVRVTELDIARERLALSLRHRNGARIAPGEAASRNAVLRLSEDAPPASGSLRDKLAAALRRSG